MDENRLDSIARKFDVTVVSRLTGSFSSRVFVVRRGADLAILKIPTAADKVVREARALLLLSHLPLTPRLLDASTSATDFAILMSLLPGRPFRTAQLSDSSLYALGEHLGAIHRVLPEQELTSWASFLEESILRRINQCRSFEFVRWARLEEELLSQVASIPVTELRVLSHYDLRPGNVLQHDGCITGVIDYESSDYAASHLDLLRIATELGGLSHRRTQIFLAGYQARGHVPPDLEQRAPLYALYHSLCCVSWSLRRGRVHDEFAQKHIRALRLATSDLTTSD